MLLLLSLSLTFWSSWALDPDASKLSYFNLSICTVFKAWRALQGFEVPLPYMAIISAVHNNRTLCCTNLAPFCSKVNAGWLIILLVFCGLFTDVNSHNKVVVCYVASWAAYRPGKGAFTWENVDPSLCTHIIYTFAGINNQTFNIHSMDPFLDTEDFGGRGCTFLQHFQLLIMSINQSFSPTAGQYKKFLNFKDRQPKLKVTVAVGGWNEGSGKYSDMASTTENRKAFIDSVMAFIKYYLKKTDHWYYRLFWTYLIPTKGNMVLMDSTWIGNIQASAAEAVLKIETTLLSCSRFLFYLFRKQI